MESRDSARETISYFTLLSALRLDRTEPSLRPMRGAAIAVAAVL